MQYDAKAIGAASEGAQNSLKEQLLIESTDENGKPKFEKKVSFIQLRNSTFNNSNTNIINIGY